MFDSDNAAEPRGQLVPVFPQIIVTPMVVPRLTKWFNHERHEAADAVANGAGTGD
jgi:hypothetical protein